MKMSGEEDKSRGGVSNSEFPPHYGTFQGVANYPPPPLHPPHQQPVIGFPQPIASPGVDPSAPLPPDQYYAHGYQSVPGYAIAEGTPVRARRLPCCGIGVGWFLFIIGFVIGTIPWYIGLLVLLCGRHRIDQREKSGYIACTIAAVIATAVIIIFVVSRGGTHDWRRY